MNRTPGEQPAEPFAQETTPLELPIWAEDWGGDERDLTGPVRAHVLAALIPITAPYAPPLDALLRLGDPRNQGVGVAQQALPITQAHVPALVRMARDRALNTANSDSLEVWAPIHALDLLTTLDIRPVLADLLPLYDLDSDWLRELREALFVKAGPAALPLLRDYLLDRTRWAFGRSAAADTLAELVDAHPPLRELAVTTLREVLRSAEHNHDSTNALVIANLIDLEADEALPEIRHAFEVDQVDEMVNGSWGDVLHQLGYEPEDDDPLVAESTRRLEQRRDRLFPAELRASIQQLFGDFPIGLPTQKFAPVRPQASAPTSPIPPTLPHAATPISPVATVGQSPTPPTTRRESPAAQQARKAKSKRKMAQASRKANQRRKKR